MRRWQLWELHELPWFPPVWRDLLTDFMSFFARRWQPYAAAAALLQGAMERTGDRAILDLCSGAAEPVLTVQDELQRRGVEVTVTVSDLYPNLQVFRRLEAARPQRVRCLRQAVDAKAVPQGLQGFRTFFSAFHHFRPEEAATILRGAVEQGEGVGVFEYTERNLLRWGPLILALPLFVWAVTPLIRPRSLTRLLWTYLLPVVPLVAAWDALVSVLRSYHPEELLALGSRVDGGNYHWEAGRVPAFGPCRITYLLGVPRRAQAPPGSGRGAAGPASA